MVSGRTHPVRFGSVFLNVILQSSQFGEGRNSIGLWIGELVLPWHRVRFLVLLAAISEQPLAALQKSLHGRKRIQAQSEA